MHSNNLYEISILVNGKPVTEYTTGEKTLVEGRKGSEYKIRVKNNTGTRVEAVVSVDGLSVMTGKDASSTESGYLVPAYGTLDIPGFRLDGNEAAKFTFSEKEQSYAVQSGKDGSNVGVIGVKIFPEKYYYNPVQINNIWNDGLFPKAYPYYSDTTGTRHLLGGSGGLNSSSGGANGWELSSNSFFCDSGEVMPFAASASASGGGSMSKGALRSASAGITETVNQAAPVEKIGTEFGRATDFATTEVSFTRAYATASATMVLHYGSRKQLEQQGVVFPKPKKSHAKETKAEPQAFPGDRCTPPANWKR